MRFPTRFSPYTEAFFRLIYPASCGACLRLLEIEENGICRTCQNELSGLRFGLSEACLEHDLSPLGNIWSLYPYESPFKEILNGIKFSNKRWLLRLFEQDLKDLGSSLAAEDSYDAVIPVPLDPARLLQRHFNQAEILAGTLANAMRLPLTKILKKKYSTPAQSRLGHDARRTNLYQVFKADSAAKLAGKKILLVDDMLTTGATAQEAARTLKSQGAKRVDLVALGCTGRTPQSSPVESFEEGSFA